MRNVKQFGMDSDLIIPTYDAQKASSFSSFLLLCILTKTFSMDSTETPLSIFQHGIHHEV